MRLSLWLILVVLTSRVLAQAPIRHLTRHDGLSGGRVSYILRDVRGFMWMGTENGLNRFDGQHFQFYPSSETDSTTMGKGVILGLAEAPSGDLWVGSEECLNRYDRRRNVFERIYATDSTGRKISSGIRLVGVDSATVWYLSEAEGLMAYHYRTHRKERLLSPFDHSYSNHGRWYRPSHQDLFILLPKGLLRYELRNRRVTYLFTNRPDDQVGKEDVSHSFFCSRDGLCWLGSEQGLIRFSTEHPNQYQLFKLPFESFYSLNSLAEDSAGRILLGPYGQGLVTFDPVLGKVVEQLQATDSQANSLANAALSCIYVDLTGIIWVNPFKIGVDIIYPKSYQIQHMPLSQIYPKDFIMHHIGQLAQDSTGLIWIGVARTGIRSYDPRTGVVQSYAVENWPSTAGIRALFCDRKQRIWAGTNTGLCLLEANRKKSRFIMNQANPDNPSDANQITGILDLPDEHMIVTTRAGLYQLKLPFQAFQPLSALTDYLNGPLYFDAVNKLLYVSATNELRCYRYKNGTFRQLKSVLTGYQVQAIRPDSLRHCFWLGTDKGIVQLDWLTQKLVRHITVSAGLLSECVLGILPDKKGQFWVSTCAGLVRLNPTNGKVMPIPSTSNTVYSSLAALLAKDGMMYFGTDEGIDYFRPEAYERPYPIQVQFTHLLIDDKTASPVPSITETTKLVLDPDDNNFTLSFAALDYLNQEPTRYQYRLVGVDKSWTPVGSENAARYARVAPGTYLFQVRAQDSKGYWTAIRQLPIVVKPHFWQTAWFFLLIFLLLIGVTVGLVRLYLNNRLRIQRRLMYHVIEAQEAERRRIAQDLHDDLGNTLAAAKGVLGQLDKKTAANAKVQEVTHMVSRASQDIRTISHDLMPVEFERYALGDVLRQLVEKTQTASATGFVYVQAGDERKLPPDRELVIYRIVSELITNVVKHAQAKLAIVQLIYQPDWVVISVEDDGLGNRSLNNELKSTGIGLKNVTSRCQYLSARQTYHADATGTIVLIEIPSPSSGAGAHPDRRRSSLV